MLGMGMNIVVGYAGLMDLGYIAFYGIAAYTIAALTAEFDLAAVLGGVSAGGAADRAFGVLLGAPTLRLRPDYLAMVTVGFGEIARLSFLNLDDDHRRAAGHHRNPATRSGVSSRSTNTAQLYWVIVVAGDPDHLVHPASGVRRASAAAGPTRAMMKSPPRRSASIPCG